MSEAELTRPVQSLRGVGPAVQEKLNRLGIFTVQDVLFHLPLRYQDRTRVAPIGSLELGEEVVVEADIQAADIALGKRRSLLVRIHDGTGGATLRFFHFNAQQQQQFKQYQRVRIFGEARRGPVGFEFVHPEYSFIDEHSDALPATLTPVYPTTEGLAQTTWRKLTDQALQQLEKSQALNEYLPAPLRQQLKLQPLREALFWVHRPPPEVSLFAISEGHAAPIQRLAFEELLAHHLSMQQLRNSVRKNNAPV
ncbi:MAG TPA: ATP-dependent DNA helicase RecG, partial [Pseudomonadales bacterium]|nr:ATP-dependent DNA helicase RecG [Pseudomonadales bacterium]